MRIDKKLAVLLLLKMTVPYDKFLSTQLFALCLPRNAILTYTNLSKNEHNSAGFNYRQSYVILASLLTINHCGIVHWLND